LTATTSRPSPGLAVFHLFGHIRTERSLVVTEDEYLDFLIDNLLQTMSASSARSLPRFSFAFAQHSLLFLGYRMADLEFRV